VVWRASTVGPDGRSIDAGRQGLSFLIGPFRRDCTSQAAQAHGPTDHVPVMPPGEEIEVTAL
jgi:hypothetical protein